MRGITRSPQLHSSLLHPLRIRTPALTSSPAHQLTKNIINSSSITKYNKKMDPGIVIISLMIVIAVIMDNTCKLREISR